MKSTLLIILGVSTVSLSLAPVAAANKDLLKTPAAGILCDQYFCADEYGISNGLTSKYLGQPAANDLASLDYKARTKFTYSNGITCDVSERRCYESRVHNSSSGKQSRVSMEYTTVLFGGPVLILRRPPPRY